MWTREEEEATTIICNILCSSIGTTSSRGGVFLSFFLTRATSAVTSFITTPISNSVVLSNILGVFGGSCRITFCRHCFNCLLLIWMFCLSDFLTTYFVYLFILHMKKDSPWDNPFLLSVRERGGKNYFFLTVWPLWLPIGWDYVWLFYGNGIGIIGVLLVGFLFSMTTRKLNSTLCHIREVGLSNSWAALHPKCIPKTARL